MTQTTIISAADLVTQKYPLLGAAGRAYTYEMTRYQDAIVAAQRVCKDELSRLAQGRKTPDNSLGLLQTYAAEVDRLAATACAARKTVLLISAHLGVHLEAVLEPHEVAELIAQGAVR